MSRRLQRVVRCILTTSVVVSVALLVLSWVWRGYEPPLQFTGQPITGQPKFSYASAPLAFSPQGDVLAVGSMPTAGSSLSNPLSPIHFLNAADGTEVRPPLPTHAEFRLPIHRAEYSPDGRLLAVLQPSTNSPDKMELVVFDLQSGTRVLAEQTATPSSGRFYREEQVAFGFAPDSSFIYLSGPIESVSNAGSWWVGVWDLPAGKRRFTLDQTGHPSVSPDSKWLVSIDDQQPNDFFKRRVLKLHSAQTGETERTIELSLSGRQSNWLWPSSFSPDGKLLATRAGATTEVFDTATGNRVFAGDKYCFPRFLANGMLLTVAGSDVQLWDPAPWQLKQTHTFDLGRHWDNGDLISPKPAVAAHAPRGVVFNYYPSQHSAWLQWMTRTCRVNAGGSSHMTLINASDASRRPIELHKDGYYQITTGAVFSPGGERIAIGYSNGDIEIWKLPPQPSFVAPCVAAALVLVSLALQVGLGKRIKPAATESSPTVADGIVPTGLERT